MIDELMAPTLRWALLIVIRNYWGRERKIKLFAGCMSYAFASDQRFPGLTRGFHGLPALVITLRWRWSSRCPRLYMRVYVRKGIVLMSSMHVRHCMTPVHIAACEIGKIGVSVTSFLAWRLLHIEANTWSSRYIMFSYTIKSTSPYSCSRVFVFAYKNESAKSGASFTGWRSYMTTTNKCVLRTSR